MLYRFGFLVYLLAIFHTVYAREFMVGGSKGWTVPSDHQLYNQWAEQTRFQINDSAVCLPLKPRFSTSSHERCLYDTCNTDAATAKFTDGHTSFTLNRSGPYYFISGNKDNCHKNQKLVIIVMANRSTSNTTPPSPYTGTFDITPAPSQETPGNTASQCSFSVLHFAFAFSLVFSLFS